MKWSFTYRYKLSAVTIFLAFCVSGSLKAQAKYEHNFPLKKAVEKQELQVLTDIDTVSADYRLSFRKNNFDQVVKTFPTLQDPNAFEKFILAESLYRLKNFRQAKEIFNELLLSKIPVGEKDKIYIRLFDIAIHENSLQEAINYFVQIKKRLKNVPAIVRYKLGMKLIGTEHEQKGAAILSPIKNDNEFFIRSKYALAVSLAKRKKNKSALLAFKKLAESKPTAVEDYTVIELAKLAMARIYASINAYDKAFVEYEKVLRGSLKASIIGEVLTLYLKKGEDIQKGVGKYKRISPAMREAYLNDTYVSASSLLNKYNVKKLYNFEDPTLMGKIALLYAHANRFDEGKKVLDDIISHYLSAITSLNEDEDKIWPIFALKNDLNNFDQIDIVKGLANNQFFSAEAKDLLALKARVEESKENLSNILQMGEQPFESIVANQNLLEEQYKLVALQTQEILKNKIKERLSEKILEAKFLRTKIPLMEMESINKQIKYSQQYQIESNKNFDEKIKENKNGGSL